MSDNPTDKSAEERAEEYADLRHKSYLLAWHHCKSHFLAGRADFIEHDLKGKVVLSESDLRALLEMARYIYDAGGPFEDWSYTIEQILQKARDGK